MAERNAPCPCGSGRKHKVCCATVQPRRTRWISASAVVLFLLAAGWVIGSALRGDRELPEGWVWSDEHGHPHQVSTPGFVEPPPGSVWVPEHGHFHDAAGNPVGGATPTPEHPPVQEP